MLCLNRKDAAEMYTVISLRITMTCTVIVYLLVCERFRHLVHEPFDS